MSILGICKIINSTWHYPQTVNQFGGVCSFWGALWLRGARKAMYSRFGRGRGITGGRAKLPRLKSDMTQGDNKQLHLKS